MMPGQGSEILAFFDDKACLGACGFQFHCLCSFMKLNARWSIPRDVDPISVYM